jgi:hypothetical protein
MKNLIKRYWQLLAGMMAGVLLAGAGLGLVVATNGLDNEAGEIENIAPGALSVTDEEARAAVLEAYPGVTSVRLISTPRTTARSCMMWILTPARRLWLMPGPARSSARKLTMPTAATTMNRRTAPTDVAFRD